MNGNFHQEIAELHATFAEPVTPKVLNEVKPLIDWLQGRTDDVDEANEEKFDINLTKAHYQQIDRKIWRCEDCQYWCQIGELDEDGHCYGCSTSRAED